MHMVLIISLGLSCFSCFGPRSMKRCHDDKSHTSSVSVARRWPVVALTTEVSGACGAPQGAIRAEVADDLPRLSDSAKSVL
jgi:hypothetical protein